MNNTNLLKTGFVNERFRYYEKLVAELTMMSDMFMRNVLNILECAEYVLRVITENDDLELTEVVVQKDYKNLQGRSAVLDCVAVNGRKEIYDIEVQQEKAGAGPKRLRYHSSIIDAHSLFAGEDFEKLPESKVIFIVDEEVENEVAPILHIKRTVRETGRDYNDKSEIIYINARMKENGMLPVKRTIKNNKFLYRQPCYGWRYFMLLLYIAHDISLVSLHAVSFEVVGCCSNLCN